MTLFEYRLLLQRYQEADLAEVHERLVGHLKLYVHADGFNIDWRGRHLFSCRFPSEHQLLVTRRKCVVSVTMALLRNIHMLAE